MDIGYVIIYDIVSLVSVQQCLSCTHPCINLVFTGMVWNIISSDYFQHCGMESTKIRRRYVRWVMTVYYIRSWRLRKKDFEDKKERKSQWSIE